MVIKIKNVLNITDLFQRGDINYPRYDALFTTHKKYMLLILNIPSEIYMENWNHTVLNVYN